MNFFAIFKNKSKHAEEKVPMLTSERSGNSNITETAKVDNVDFEVTEISYEEFVSTPLLERRSKKRKT